MARAVVNNNHNPTWNFLFKTNDYNTGDKVEFDCYDKDVFTSDSIGKGEMVLARGVTFSGTVKLNTQGSMKFRATPCLAIPYRALTFQAVPWYPAPCRVFVWPRILGQKRAASMVTGF